MPSRSYRDGPAASRLERSDTTGASRFIEMTRVDKIHAMDSGAVRRLQSDAPEVLGGAIESEHAKRAHARLKRMNAFESHDYDPIDNDVEEEARRSRKRGEYAEYETWKWLMSVLIGLVMGLIAFTVDGLIEKFNDIKFGAATSVIERDRSARFGAWFVFVALACLLAAVAGAFVSYVEPLAAGSGIPEVKTYLNGVHLKGLLKLRTIIAKLGGIAFSIGSGLIAGKEGPFVHGGGLVGGGLSAFGSHTLGFKTHKPACFRNDADKRDFVAIGTSAGVAVAFGAPIGGMLFTLEEGASFLSNSMMWRAFLATCTGVLVTHWLNQLDFDAGDFARAKFGTHRDFGLYTDDEANYSRIFWWYFWEVPIFAAVGCLGGLAGAFFVNVNVKITMWRQSWIPVKNRARRHLEVVFICFVTATLCFVLTAASPCRRVPAPLREETHEIAAGDYGFEYGVHTKDAIRTQFFRQLYCDDGEYSAYGQLFFSPLSQSFKYLLHLGEVGEFGGDAQNPGQHAFDMDALILYWLIMFTLMTWTYGIGAPTGLFVPSLTVGAAMGQIVGRTVHAAVASTGSTLTIDLHTYAVIGAAASLGGATRMTVSITLLVMETTGAMQLIIPLMITIFFAKTVGDKYSYGIYDTHIKIRGAPFLNEPELTGPGLDKLRVNEVMAANMVSLKPIAKVRDVVDALTRTSHGAFPISEDDPPGTPGNPGETIELHGSITRGLLLKMLTHRVSFFNPAIEGGRDRRDALYETATERDELLEKLKQIPFKVRSISHWSPYDRVGVVNADA